MAVKHGLLKQGMPGELSVAEMKYMRRTAGYTWDRLQNKFTHCKGIRNNTGSRQTAGIQEELDTTCKQNAS